MSGLSFTKLLLLLFIAVAISTMSAHGEIPRELVVADSNPLARVAQTGVRVTYLGTNGYLFETRDATLLVDPYFSRIGVCAMVLNARVESNAERVRNALARLPRCIDAILVTHGHVDHLLDAPAIRKATGATIVASRASISLVEAGGVSRAGCRSIAPGEVTTIAGCTVHALPALHDRLLGHVPFPGLRPSSGITPQRVADWVCGEPLAFLIEIGGERIYIDSGGRPELLPPRGELQEKERLRQTFGLHVGRQAAEQILARDPGLGGVEEVITVMFVDIRAFTARAAASSPREVVQLLNEFLRVMVQVVEEQHGGMINKFLGDGFMALFGVGNSDAHADNALAAARDMLRALTNLNEVLERDGGKSIAIGVGIHSGGAIVGSIGSPQRLEFTAIGDTVNLASRMETLTKQIGVPVLMTEATRLLLRDTAGLEKHPPQAVKGIEEPVSVFSVRA
jgi:class 3 adenylate cyclase/L-ascorbate metabolism protein UlaG (beta-lactamase superfamily)